MWRLAFATMLATRLRELDKKNSKLVDDLAREALRNEDPETIEVNEESVTVVKPRFRGTHSLKETTNGLTVADQGEYTTRIEDVDLTFSVRSLDPETEGEIEKALRDAGYETVEQHIDPIITHHTSDERSSSTEQSSNPDSDPDPDANSSVSSNHNQNTQPILSGSIISTLKSLFK